MWKRQEQQKDRHIPRLLQTISVRSLSNIPKPSLTSGIPFPAVNSLTWIPTHRDATEGLWDTGTGLGPGEGKTQTVAGATCPGGPKEQLHGHVFLWKLMPASGFNVLVKSQALSLFNTSIKYQVYLLSHGSEF